jgi:hypothetical protein
MASVNVSITFEAENTADAEAKIASWRLHEGCTVMVSVSETLPPAAADTEGRVEPVPQPEPLPPPPEQPLPEQLSEAPDVPPEGPEEQPEEEPEK